MTNSPDKPPSRPSRIALFTRSLSGGGAERVLLALAGEMTRRGVSVDLVVGTDEGAYRNEVPKGVQLISLRSRRQWPLLWRLGAYLRRERPAAVLATPYRYNLTALWARLLSRSKTRIVVREASYLPAKLRDTRSRIHALKKRLISYAARSTYRTADGIVAVSEGVAEGLVGGLRLPRNRIAVIPNPVDVDAVQSLARRDNPLESFFGQGPVIVSAGRLTRQKGFSTLLRAFAGVLRERPEARLCILGEGPLRARLEAQAREAGFEKSVLLPGFLSNPFPVIAASSVFASSSRWEGFPNVLLQAMALGRAIVATDCPGGSSQILEGGRWGTLVPVGDADGLAAALLQRLGDAPPPPRDLEVQARRYGLDRITMLYLKVLGVAAAPG